MKKSVKLASVLALAVGLGAVSSAIAAETTQTIPYLYVYSVVGDTPGKKAPVLAKATLNAAMAGDNTTVGLPPGGLPYTATTANVDPLVMYVTQQLGTGVNPVSGTLTYSLTVGSNSSTCVYKVSSPNIGGQHSVPNGAVELISDSGGSGLCTMFNVPVFTVNPQDGDQIVVMNFKSSF